MSKTSNFNFNCDLSPVVLWQYQDAPRFKALIQNQQDFLNAAIRDFWTDFNKNFLNIRTANSDGLSMWGRLLGVARPVYTNKTGEKIEFTDEQYRLLLQGRVYLLTFDGSARSLNRFFKLIFPDAVIEIKDNYDMTARISFITPVPPEYKILFTQPWVDVFLPRPSGVSYITDLAPTDYTRTFGFEGMTDALGNSVAGFDNGTFYQ